MSTERSLTGAVVAGAAIAVALMVLGLLSSALHVIAVGLAHLPH